MMIKYRVHEVAKDLEIPNKDVIDVLKDYTGETKKHMTALTEDELDLVFESFTQKNNRESDVYKRQGLFRPAVFALLCALLYAAAAALLRRFRPSFYRRVSPLLSPAAINCVVLSLPFYQSSLAAGPLAALGFALGTGLSFLAASVVLRELLANSRRSGVPEAVSYTHLSLFEQAFRHPAVYGKSKRTNRGRNAGTDTAGTKRTAAGCFWRINRLGEIL